MHIYNLGYHTYEESDYVQLYHKKKYSKKEFEKVVAKAAVSVLKNSKNKKENKISFQDIFFSLIEGLVEQFGFKEVKFDAEFSVFGWANILDEKDWKHDRDKQLNELTRSLKTIKDKTKRKIKKIN